MRIDVYNYFIFFFCYFQKANFLWLNSFFLGGYYDLRALFFWAIFFFVYKKILAIALIRRCQ